MNRQKKFLGIGAVLLIALTAVFLGGCTNPASPEPAKYSVSYDGNGNTGGTAPVDATTYTEGSSVTVLANTNLVKTGNGFQGWATTSGATSPEYAAGATFAMPAKNLTLYAVWAKAKTWTVTFDSNSGSAVESQIVTDGQKASEPTPPTRTDYAFNGWYTSATFDAKWDFAANTVTAAVTLYAKWGPIPTYTVSYNANGATGDVPVDAALYRAASDVTIAGKGKLAVAGKTFLGWSETNTATTAAYVPGTISMPAKNLTLYAVWTNQKCWTLTFDSNGGTSVDSQQGLLGTKATEPTAPTKEGSTFYGWYTDNWYSTKWDFTQNVISADTTLYAKFVKDGAISIIFAGIADETIDLSQSDDQSLSKAKQDTATISLGATFDSYAWYVDGSTYSYSSYKTLYIQASSFYVGVHTVTVIVTKGGVPYSKQLRFRVVY